MTTEASSHDDGARDPFISNRLRSTERLRRLAELWPSFDDDERAVLERHLHRLREKASV